MPTPYVCIQDGVVINIQMCNPTDYFNPLFVWLPAAGLLCNDGVTPVTIGCTYDGTNFYAPQGQ
jgi:hypothetical protein